MKEFKIKAKKSEITFKFSESAGKFINENFENDKKSIETLIRCMIGNIRSTYPGALDKDRTVTISSIGRSGKKGYDYNINVLAVWGNTSLTYGFGAPVIDNEDSLSKFNGTQWELDIK